ncbi:GNAT family N-acetyltransferase [uncultured Psychromonas sp.]|uniref:GNAT family N-acetyltransferase n=1 Tax=uncultured Psychromonas sp. TaxID=173974 RepID=UPI0026247AB7|nr:GNAT family N-acetyltransferase [uncultured Psychromonas sp.]
MKVRLMEKTDLENVAEIHRLTFVRQQNSLQWIQCNFNAFPRFLNFVAEKEGKILGYIIWIQKSGFRPQAVIELEQLAVSPNFQNQGVGRQLITESLALVNNHLSLNGSTLKHIIVTTRADNFAQQLYKSTLGAEIETTITNLYSDDEVLMIARNVNTKK